MANSDLIGGCLRVHACLALKNQVTSRRQSAGNRRRRDWLDAADDDDDFSQAWLGPATNKRHLPPRKKRRLKSLLVIPPAIDMQDLQDEAFVFRLNDNGGGPNLLQKVCAERGWQEHSTSVLLKDTWNLWWRSNGFSASLAKQLGPKQYTNHIPKGATICRKDVLARCLRCMSRLYGSIYHFSPDVFHLPLDYTKLVAEINKNRYQDLIWICKPVGLSQGKGIFLFRRLSDLYYENHTIVQKYISNPLLIGGYKFDLRLYVCIPCYRPLVVYLYREGLARFATDKFQLDDLTNLYSHLTNCSLNKQGPGYTLQKETVGAGCKWTLKQLRRYMTNTRSDWLLWQKVACLVVLTLLSQGAAMNHAPNCFEFYGFDVLVDRNLKPWLMEVNLSPALGLDCDADSTVKKPMLHDLFDLLGMPVCNTGLSLYSVKGNQQIEMKSDIDESISSNAAAAAAAKRWHIAHNKKRKGITARRYTKTPCRIQNVNVGQGMLELDTAWEQFRNTGIWGNGRNWNEAPESEGDWVRIFPMMPRFGELDLRSLVGEVVKYLRSAKEAFRIGSYLSDNELNILFHKKIGASPVVWLPPK